MERNGAIYKDFEKLSAENISLKDRILGYQEKLHDLRNALKNSNALLEKAKSLHKEMVAEKDAVIKALANRVAHLEAIAAHDGTNTGVPTSATPIGKKKVIPNSRGNSGKKRGGQPGHPKHFLPRFCGSEVTEIVIHTPEGVCAACGGELKDSGETVSKDEYDVEIRTVKRRHEYRICRCAGCGAEARQPIPGNLKENNQYGGGVQALALSLMNTGNVAINKVRALISGMTDGAMTQSEGFITKLQGRAAMGLAAFVADLKTLLIQRPLVYWDDTVIMINTARACLRFYGDKSISFYAAHAHKDMESLEDDGILGLLTPETTAVHDHNRVNYNDKFCFRNLECNQHLQRDLQKNADDIRHAWSADLKKTISSTIHERKQMIAKGETRFPPECVEKFKEKVSLALSAGWEENKGSARNEAAKFERALLARIDKYRENYFIWVEDFSLPTTNNLSERGLRCVKTHMKVSGQFANVKTARYYATIKTYIETCRKNGINEMAALSRLCMGNPYTASEIFSP
ncbi:MAG: transposase [Desulfovibrio sp.]|jgi:transposase|nr:transposase [Desulfovibrio sp.]